MAYERPALLGSHHELDGFDCGEPALNDWLTRHAQSAQGSGSARVFVTVSSGTDTVVGYYATAAAGIEPADAIERVRKGQPGHRAIPAILLARMAVDLEHQGRGVGRSRLQDALLRVVEAADVIGVRVFLVHAKNEEAKTFYTQYGFEESPTDPLHLMMILKDVRLYLDERK